MEHNLFGCQNTKENKSDGPIINVFKNKGKLIVMASKVMCFWKEVRGGQAMGIGQFPAWDNFELDMGKIQILEKQFEKVKTTILVFC